MKIRIEDLNLSSLSDEDTSKLAGMVIHNLVLATRKEMDGNGTAMIAYTGNDNPFDDHFIAISVGPEARESEAALKLAALHNAGLADQAEREKDEPKQIYP